MDFLGMKRKDLQALCKKHGIPANLANLEMAHRLALLLQEGKKPEVSDKDTEPVVVANNVKKVKFSPENETFIFVESDSDSDSDFVSERTMRLRNRKTAKGNDFEEKNVTGKVRVTTRSQAKSVSVVEEDSKLVSLPVNGRERGKEIVDVSEPKRELNERQLRRRKLVHEAAEIGDRAVSGGKIMLEGSKKTVDGKASDGFLLEDRIFEDAAKGAPKPEKINKNSKQTSRKDKGSGVAPTEDIEKVGIGVETRRVRALAFRSGSTVDSKCDEPLKGVGKNETAMENNPKKRQELEEVSDLKTNSDDREQNLPQAPMRRTRRTARLFSPDGLTVSANEETCEPKKKERGAKRGNPPKQSARLASKVTEIDELASKKGQKKQRQDPNLNQQSFANVQEASNDKHPKRSTRNTFKGINVELVERTIMGTAAENDKLKTMSLPVEETPAIYVELVAPEALESKAYPDSNKGDTSRSSEDGKDFRRKSAIISPLQSAPGSAVNEVTTDMTLNLEGQRSLSAKRQGVSVIEPTMESIVELIKEKESSTIEEVKENSRDENIEGGVDDSLLSSLDTVGDSRELVVQQVEDPKKLIDLDAIFPDSSLSLTYQVDSADSSDYQLVQQVEDPKKHIDVDAIFPDSSVSPTYKVDSEGEPSNCLDIEETLETEEPVIGNSIGLRRNEMYVKSSDGDRANDNSGQDLLNEVAEGRESERYSENLSEEAENTCPIFSQAINTEMVEKIYFCNVTLGNSGAVPCEPATESQDGTEVLDERAFSREAEFSWECVQACHDEKTEVISATKEHESKEALNKGLQSVGTISIDLSCNLDDALVGGEDNVNGSGYATALKSIYEEILVRQVEADATCTRRIDLENIESANNPEKEHSADSSCKSLEAYSTTCLLLNVSSPHDQLGDEDGPPIFSEDKIESTNKEAIAEDEENEGSSNDKSNAGESNEDPSVATNELNQQYNVSTSEFSDELFDDHKGEAEKANSINEDNLTPVQSLCDNGTDSVVKQMEQALDVHAMDDKPISSEDLQKVGALADLSFHKEMIQNINVDCFISSLDKRNSEHQVQTAEVTALVSNTSFRSGEEGNVEYVHELFEEANSGSKNDVEKKEINEDVIASEDFDQVFESKLGERVHHSTKPAVSEDLISGDYKDSNEQDDVSAIIQEYMERETRIDELTKTDSSDPLNKGNMTRVYVEDAETNSVVELGLDKVFNNCGEEDDETLSTSTKRMEIDEEDIGMVADTMELPEIKDSAPTECTDAVPVNHKISETPDVIRETTVPCDDEVKFEDVESNVEVSTELDGSASMALDNSAFKDGKATTSKGKVRRMFGDSNSQAINFLGETKVRVDSVPHVLSDDISDKLAYEEVHGWDDDNPDTALVSPHGNDAVLFDESGGESLEGRTGSDSAEYGTELHGEAPIVLPKVEESCRLDENNSTALKLMIDFSICSPLTGKESECQAYKKCTKNSMEGMELENMDGGIIPREIDSPKQGNIDLGSYQKDSQHRQYSLKEGCLTGDIDFLELNNLFRSNSAKINFKQTGNHLDFQNSANLEVPFGASKDTADLEEVQCPADSFLTATSNGLMRLTTTEFSAGRKIENNTADSDADLPFFTGFELNLFSEDSQREEVDIKYQRKFEENLMSDTNGDMKRGGDNSVSITTVSAEQGYHLEKEMVVDIDFLKQNQLFASDEPKNEIGGSKQEGIVSDKPFVFEDSIEASKNIKESSGASAKCPSYDENNANVAGNFKSSGSKDVTTFAMTRLEEAMVETTDLNEYGSEVNATMASAALDGPITECRGSVERGGVLVETIGATEFENSTNFAASGEPTAECGADVSKQLESSYSEETGIVVLSSLIKNDSSEDMLEAMDSSKGASVTNVESLDDASDEPIYCNVGTNEKCEVSIINQENVDCENDKDDFVLLEKCQETTEIEGSSSASSKHATEFGGKDSNKGDPAPLNLDVERKGAVYEDAKARQAKFEFVQENSSETNLYQSINTFANPIMENDINVSVPATPKIVQKAHDMKENVQSVKMEQFGSVAMSRKSAKRRPLEDLQKN